VSVSELSRSEDQRLLAQTAERFVAEHYAHGDWRKVADSDSGFSEARWRDFADLGWLGLGIPEDCGGYGGSLADALTVVTELAKGLATEPIVSTTIIGAHLLRSASEAVRPCVADIVSGQLRLAWAHDERPEPARPWALATSARAIRGGWQIEGAKALVEDAPHAHRLIVSARMPDRPDGPDALGLFLVSADAPGVCIDRLRGFDRRFLGDVRLEGVALEAQALICEGSLAWAQIAEARSRALAAWAAEGLGIAERLVFSTRDYLTTREQFGEKLSGFQVLQHRLVDLFIALEELRTAARLVAIASEAGDLRMLGAVRIKLIQALPFIGRQAVQLHGGMGMTDEFHVGDCMKRLEAIALACGPLEEALDQFRWAQDEINQEDPGRVNHSTGEVHES
jgi:alkylation response protein AidB-like acyl-CoA dehydrogenase